MRARCECEREEGGKRCHAAEEEEGAVASGGSEHTERQYGLNPNDPSDGNTDLNGDGYTNLEKYLNGIDPTNKVDYTKPENNVNPFHKKS